MRTGAHGRRAASAVRPVRVRRAGPRTCQGQVTFGFQSANMPLGLCFQIHACSS